MKLSEKYSRGKKIVILDAGAKLRAGSLRFCVHLAYKEKESSQRQTPSTNILSVPMNFTAELHVMWVEQRCCACTYDRLRRVVLV